MAEIKKVNMEKLLNCALCPNLCRCDCPVLQVSGREAVSPAGKARLATYVLQNHLKWDSNLLEAVANCLGCRNCTILCPFPELNLCDELLYARTVEVEERKSLPGWEPYLNNLRKFGSPYGRKNIDKIKKPGEGEIIFFTGCTARANNRRSEEAAHLLLKAAAINYAVIDEDCCGYPAETWGDLELARQLAEENLRKFGRTGAKTLVTNCPECWQTFSERYPDWGIDSDLEIVDGPTYFLGLLKDGLLDMKRKNFGEVSYHDPCIWARTAGKTAEPRELIKAITGMDLKEPYHSGLETHCCGGGRMFQLSFPEKAAAIAARRVEDFPEGSDILTACPFCREGLKGEGRNVIELVEMLAWSCGLIEL